MSSKRGGKFDFLAEEKQQRTEEVTPPAESIENAQSIMSTSAQNTKSTSAQSSIERKPSGQRIRTDLLRAYKILAAETGTHQYLLIEEALEEYLNRKRTS